MPTEVKPVIFISHRHEDSVIADAFRRQLLNWGFTNQQIFQSSHPRGTSATIGSSIRREIRKALSKTHLVILVFTYSRFDWQYCMWEVGLASDPLHEKTRIIVLQCFDDRPKVFADDLVLSISYNEIQRFVKQFHKDPGFFPGLPEYWLDIEGDTSRDRSSTLYEALRDAAERVRITDEETTPLWGFLTLSLGKTDIEELRNLEEDDLEKIRDKLEKGAVVVDADQAGLEHFGFASPRRELRKKLGTLVTNWKRTVKDRSASDAWATDLCRDLFYGVQNWPADPAWRPFLSAGEKAYVFPLINTVRTLPESMEFDIFVYRVPPPAKSEIGTGKKDDAV